MDVMVAMAVMMWNVDDGGDSNRGDDDGNGNDGTNGNGGNHICQNIGGAGRACAAAKECFIHHDFQRLKSHQKQKKSMAFAEEIDVNAFAHWQHWQLLNAEWIDMLLF